MTKKRRTRRALINSVISLLICFSMLLGTTFAWFTDEVVTGMNTIAAGNLDVELLADGTKVDSTTKLFDDVELWEPGVVVYENLQVANVGTLALKYQMDLNFGNENNLDGHKLSEVLKVAIIDKIDDGAKRTDVLAAAKAAVEASQGDGSLSNFYLTGELEAGKSSTEQTVVIFWDANDNATDNLYNANNGKETSDGEPLHIDFGVNLQATQKMSEEDSFGPDYDKDAVYVDATYTVSEDGDFATVLGLIEAADDETVLINLNEDIEWETGASHGSTPWISESATVKNLIVDAKGHKITATGDGVGPIRMANGGTLAIKNATIVDNSASYAEDSWELGYLEFAGNLVFEDVDFVNAVMMSGETAIFNNCSFNSNKSNEYAVWVDNGSAEFTGCTFTGARGLKTHEDYGSEVDSILVDNCTFYALAVKPGMAIGTVNTDTTIIIKNSDFVNCQAGDQGLYIYETDTAVDTFNFTNTNNEVINGPEIDTAEELIALGGKSLEGYIMLTADIDMGGKAIPTIGAAYGKELTVIGNGYTISNGTTTPTVHNGMQHHGLFYAYTNSKLTISDLVIDNVDIDTTNDTERNYGVAAVLSFADGGSNVTLDNVDVKNCDILNTSDEASVYVGYQTGTLTMIDCDSTGCSVTGETEEQTGAFIGHTNGVATLTDCTTDLTIGACNRITGTLNVDGVSVFSNNDSLDEAIANGATEIILSSGNFIIPDSAQGKTLTIIGNGDTVIATQDDGSYEGCDYSLDGSTVTFENITINTDSSTYTGYARLNATYNNCTINGTYTLYGDSVFNGCTFNVSGDVYNIWTWGAPNATFNNCTFISDGKAMLLYGTVNTNLTLNDCTFNDNGGLTDLKAAIEIGNDYDKSYTLTVNNTTVNGYEINDKGISTGTTLWANKNSMGTDKLNVVVDGVDVY